MRESKQQPAEGERWLLLIHQLPAKPAYLRVKIWRRMQGLGAVAVKNAVYALPAGEQAQEDFEWLLREIVEGGGEGVVCEARFVDGLSDDGVRGLFNRARDSDYEALAKEARGIASALGRKPSAEARAEVKQQLSRLRARLAQALALDFFGANGRESVEGLLDDLERRAADPAAQPAEAEPVDSLGDLKGRTWVTRSGVHVDRIASAWLIRRFIDPDARFKFAPPKGYRPAKGELRFDMFDAEFTHEGDKCTFEVLLERARLKDAALAAVAQIVHDIDLKDGKFSRDEAAGIARLIAGIAMTSKDDDERLARGGAVFEDLYGYFSRKRGAR
jgi:hypothetical protein